MDNDDYWNTSETKAYNFDDDVLSPKEILAIGRPSLSTSSLDNESVLNVSKVKSPLLPLSALMPSKVLETVLQAHSGKDPFTKQIQTNEVNSVSLALKRIVICGTSSLHGHRSLSSKTALLDAAVAIGDGNTILSVILFLLQTLNKKLVQELLSSRPLALNHYIGFLHSEGKITELTDLLTMFGRTTEAAMYQFQYVLKTEGSNVDLLMNKLNNTLCNHFQLPRLDINLINIVNNYIKFLEWLKCVNDPKMNSKSVIECLSYCCMNHWNEGAGKMMSPLTLCQQQQITPLQYDWVVLNVHAILKNWDIVESLFSKKGWLGRTTMTSNIPLPLMILRLSELNASKQLMANLINTISNAEERLDIAKQYKVHSVIIESFAKQKDRVSLSSYKMSLNPQSEEYILAENTLRNLSIKWKN